MRLLGDEDIRIRRASCRTIISLVTNISSYSSSTKNIIEEAILQSQEIISTSGRYSEDEDEGKVKSLLKTYRGFSVDVGNCLIANKSVFFIF